MLCDSKQWVLVDSEWSRLRPVIRIAWCLHAVLGNGSAVTVHTDCAGLCNIESNILKITGTFPDYFRRKRQSNFENFIFFEIQKHRNLLELPRVFWDLSPRNFAPRTPAFFEIRARNFPEAFHNRLASLREPALNFPFDSTGKLPRKGVTKLAQRVFCYSRNRSVCKLELI